MNSITKTGLTLGLCVLVAIAALSAAHSLTRERIEKAQQQWLQQGLIAVLPEGPFDAEPLDSAQMITAPELGSDVPQPLYTVYQNQTPSAAVLSVIAPDGYNGDIHLLLGLSYEGQITGVRVIEHRETPGLGDDIEYSHSDWITGFNGQSLASSLPTDWAVRKNGGSFDAFTGATITPRAVINAVYRALKWYSLHRQELFVS
ncbi:electron transport complex subunit RsxG [Granulosicoccus antarcticus]|uniref:Ion-translocating oxidoreductase complex subunit G n=1 Tax=Granulosicoccus antarcticus IMCC3135 TaxID=1192854 RepID=A0A2Z2NGM4_9GAMM|nr:electron transport complex subunit RsxG [Granulosicoccus antarcticus]ASJ70422.1 Electron transport complex subunit RsxG [Granulosicoccus antarcticus IMCC3135]